MIIQPSKEIWKPKLILPPKGLTIPKPRVPLQMMAPQSSSYLFGVAGRRRISVSPYYPVGADCVGYWPFGDGSDGYGDPTFADHSSYGNHGTNFGSTMKPFGSHFDGTDDRVTVTHTDSLNLTTIHVMVWMQWQQWESYAAIVEKSAAGSDGWGLWNGHSWNGPFFYTQHYYHGYWYPYSGLGINLALDTWYFIDGFGIVGSANVGYDLNYGTGGTFTTEESITNTTNILIGGWAAGGYLHCTIGEVFLFNAIKDLTYKTDIRNFTKGRYGL